MPTEAAPHPPRPRPRPRPQPPPPKPQPPPPQPEQSPLPAKRTPDRIGFFDLPRSVRERIYAHYFTYPRGLFLHLVYSGHFPRPARRMFAGGHVGGTDSLTLRGRDEDEDGSDSEDGDSEWPFPSEPRFESTSFLFSTVQDTPLHPACDDNNAMSPPPLSPNDPFHSPTSPLRKLHAPSTRQRLHDLHASLQHPAFRACASLLRTCHAIHAESHSFPWRLNTMHVISAPPSQAPFLDDEPPKDGLYHLHLGVLPPNILDAIRTLGLSGDVVRELPPRSRQRVDDMVVQRRVWGVVEREMAGLRRLMIGGHGVGIRGCEGARFLRWVLGQEGVGRGKCRALVEGGFVEGERDGGEGIGEYYVDSNKQDNNGSRSSSSGSGDAMTARMELPKSLREVKIRMLLPERLRRDFEALSWGDMRAVRVGVKTERVVQRCREVQWRAVVYEMRRRQESSEKGGAEGLAEKVHAIYMGTTTRDEEGDEKRKCLSDKVYDKLRRMS